MTAALLAAPSIGHAVCGDGNLEPSEECDPGGAVYIDGNPANGTCTTGNDCFYETTCCKFNCQFVGQGATCFDDNPCTVTDQCNQTGGCGGNSVPDGTGCDDGLFCTTGDTCNGGICSGPAYDCNDSNFCTDDSCNEALDTCSNVNNALACDDGLFCTVADTCSGGACTGSARDCSDPNFCTTDACDEAANTCTNTNNTLPCNDGLFCTVGDVCAGGACSGSARDCSDSTICTNDSCNEAGNFCAHANNTLACDDGLYCTVGDTCSGGQCTGPARDCSDGQVCTDDVCNEVGDTCTNPFNTAPCNDGLFCTATDACSAGSCVGSGDACDDANVCTDDACNEGADSCGYTNNALPCDDADACTTLDTCSGGSCAGGPPLVCDDLNVCTDDSCDPASGCVHDGNGDPCDDSLFCTVNDHCSGGICSGAVRDCGDDNICTSDECDEATDSCTSAFNTAPCDDADACTDGDQCSSGACVPGPPLVCDDLNVCTDDSCDSAIGCVVVANALACDDGDICTPLDACAAGACQGTGTTCGNGSTEETCGETCDDGNGGDGDGCSATCQVEVRREVVLTKVDNFDPVTPGSLLTYTVSYSNTGEGTVSGVVLSDLVDPGTTFFSAAPPPDEGTTDTWTIGELAPGQSGSIDITVVVGTELADGDSVINVATISTGEGVSAEAAETTGIALPGDTALLRVDVVAHLSSSRSPGGFVYTISYGNDGVDAAVGAVLELALPAGVTFGGASVQPASFEDASATWILGDLAPGDRGSLVVAVNVAGGLSSGTSIAACAQLQGTPAEGELPSPGLHAGACASTDIVGECDLWLSKTHLPAPALATAAAAANSTSTAASAPAAPAARTATASTAAAPDRGAAAFIRPHTVTVVGNRNVRVGMGASYSIRYRDIGFPNSLDVTIPDGLTVTLVSPPPTTIDGNVLRWLNVPSPSGSIAIRAVVDSDVVPGTGMVVDAALTDNASVVATGSFTTMALDDTTVIAEDAEPLLSVTGVRNLRPGAAGSYSLRYSRITDVNSLTVGIPPGFTVTSTSPPAESAAAGVLTWSDVHAPSGSLVIRGTVDEEAAPGTALTLTATLTNEAEVATFAQFTTLVQESGPAVSDPAASLEGTELTYEVRWLAPCSDVSSVVMTDSLPSDVEFVTAATTRGTLTRAGADVRVAYTVAEAGTPQLARIFSRLASEPAPGSLIVNDATVARMGGSISDADPVEIPDRSLPGAGPAVDVVGRLFARDARPTAMAVRLGDLLPGARLVVSLPAEIVPTSVQPPPSEVRGSVLTWTQLPTPVATVVVRGNVGLGMSAARAAFLTTTAVVRNPEGRTASEEFHTLVTIKAPKPPVVRAARFSLTGQRWIIDGGGATLVGRYQHLSDGGAMELTLPEELIVEAVYPSDGVVDGNVVRWASLPGESGKVTAFVRLAPDAAGDAGYVTFSGTLTPTGGEPLSRTRMVLLR